MEEREQSKLGYLAPYSLPVAGCGLTQPQAPGPFRSLLYVTFSLQVLVSTPSFRLCSPTDSDGTPLLPALGYLLGSVLLYLLCPYLLLSLSIPPLSCQDADR